MPIDAVIQFPGGKDRAIYNASGATSFEDEINNENDIREADPSWLPEYSNNNLPPGFTHENTWDIEDPSNNDPQSHEIRYLVKGQIYPNSERTGEGFARYAWDAKLNRPVHLKIKNLEKVENKKNSLEDESNSPAKEGAILDKLVHPNIPAVYDCFTINVPHLGGKEFTIFSMQHIQGESGHRIKEDMKSKGRGLSPIELIDLTKDIGGAISYAHENNIIHRDIKPEHILFRDSDHQAFLIDFGIAIKSEDISATSRSDYISPGSVGYMDYESFNDELPSKIGDIYAFAVTMYEIITGYHPFSEDKYSDPPTELSHKWEDRAVDEKLFPRLMFSKPHKLSDDRHLKEQLGEATCNDLDAIFAKSLAKLRVDRTQKVDEFSSALIKSLESCQNPYKKLTYQ